MKNTETTFAWFFSGIVRGSLVGSGIQRSRLCALALILIGTLIPFASATPIISEIHYDPLSDTQRVEFVEIWNTNSVPVDLNGWFFDRGIDYTFSNVTLPAGQRVVVAQNEGDITEFLGGSGSAVYTWDYGSTLANSGETIRFRRADGSVADKVKYDAADEWPVTGSGRSIQLIHPGLDRDQAGAWRAALPTPGSANAEVAVANAASVVLFDKVKHEPKQPGSASNVTVSVQVPQGMPGLAVTLMLQEVTPGNYLSITNAAYSNTWADISMSATTNGTYEAAVPASYIDHRNLVRYRIRFEAPGFALTLPYADSPSPNFAFFVYDGVSNFGTVDLSAIEQVPVYHLIAKADEVQEYILTSRVDGYPVTGTIVFDGEVYDHIRYRSKGRQERHNRVKRNLKIKLNKAQKIEHTNDHGEKMARKGDITFNGGSLTGFERLIAEGAQDSGLTESVGYKQFNLFGAPAYPADWMHLRVIDTPEENPSVATNGDFWGIYNIMGDYDSDWLQDQDLERNFIYQYKANEVQVYPPDGPYGFLNPVYTNAFPGFGRRDGGLFTGDEEFWRSRMDLDTHYRFMAANEGIAQNENAYWGKHYHNMYLNGDDGWILMPEDFDGTHRLVDVTNRTQAILRDRIIAAENLNIEWQGVVREYVDLLLNDEGINTLIEEKASLVHTPNAAISLAHADRDRWNLNYTTLDDEKVRLKQFYSERRDFLMSEYLDDPAIPDQPVITNGGPASFPADNVRLRTSAYSGTTGTVSMIEWLVAEITDPANPPAAATPGEAWNYEADPTWRSKVSYGGGRPIVDVPQGVVRPGGLYRARVRHRDSTGRWSHWSAPLQFVPADATTVPGAGLIMNEIHYNPVGGPGLDDREREFIEFRNPTGSTIDLGGFSVSNAIRFQFPVGASIPAGGYLVLAGDPEEFERMHGFAPYGEYDGSLNNGGETIEVFDAWGTLIDSVSYGTGKRWGPRADGLGPSLELMDASYDNDLPESWLSIGPIGGTPGQANTVECNGGPIVDVQFNEINYDSDKNADAGDWIELRNNTGSAINLNGWRLSDGGNSYILPTITIAAGGYLVLVEQPTVFESQHPGVAYVGPIGFSFANGGEPLLLINANGCLVDLVEYDDKTPWEFMADGNGATLALAGPGLDNAVPWSWLAGANGGTPGQDNGFPTPCSPSPGNIIINELNIDSSPFVDVGDWVEVFNAGNNFVNLSNWRFYDEGGRFILPSPTFLGPGEFLILAEKPTAFRATFPDLPITLSVVNGQGFTLRNKGERITMTDNKGCVIQNFEYDNVAPWPEGLGTGGTLSLLTPGLDPADPASWALGDGLGTPGKPNSAAACPDPSRYVIVEAINAGANWVDLRNLTGALTDISGWRLYDLDEVHEFPSNTTISAFGSIRVNSLTFGGGDTFVLHNERRCTVDEVDAFSGVVNHPPTLDPASPVFNESQANSFTFSASDLDAGQSVSFSSPNLPSGASLSPSGQFTWTPGEIVGPGTISMTVVLTDNGVTPQTSATAVSIAINEVNRPPTLSVPNQNIDEEVSWNLDLTPVDPDVPQQSLSLSLVNGPPGLALNGNRLSWTPTEAQGPGGYAVLLSISDGVTSVNRAINIVVNEVNRPPQFAVGAINATIVEREMWLHQALATDVDSLPLTYTFTGNVPPGLFYDIASGWMRWIPDENSAGVYAFVLAATDQGGLRVEQNITLTVQNGANQPNGNLCGTPDVLIPKRSAWRWAVDQTGTQWREPWIDESQWSGGSSPLGYGDDQATTTSGGQLRTTLVRRFNADNVHEISGLVLNLRRDDGAIIYLNGTEILRDNLPNGVIDENTSSQSSTFGSQEDVFHTFQIPSLYLAEGENVMAVGIHQIAASSDDMIFEAELIATRVAPCAPITINQQHFALTGEIQFGCEPGVTYMIQRCSDLAGGDWTTIGSFIPSGSLAQFVDPDPPPLVQSYYRVAR